MLTRIREILDLDNAIKHLTMFLELCKITGNRSKEGWSKVILATCYESSGEVKLSINYLLQFVSTTEEGGSQKDALAQAYFILGRLFKKQGDHMQSEKYYEHYLKLCVSISQQDPEDDENRVKADERDEDKDLKKGGKVEEVGLAKMLLGIARGNAQLENFFALVKDPTKLAPLLEFKSNGALQEAA
jgi:tetratricopeptide (TPR) repeat protein